MPHPDLDLSALREIAEGATQGEWTSSYGELSHVYDWDDGCIATCGAHYDAIHIATFDPPTILALITRAEKAEVALEDARASAFDEAAKMIENRLGVSSIAKQLIGALRAAAADTGARVAQEGA